MKIISITGSPRKNGTSSRIANSFVNTAKDTGAEIKSYHLNNMNYSGCQGCNKCKTKSDICILKDDLTPLLQDLSESDILIFATPVYYGDTTGQFKNFFDRTWSFVTPSFKSKFTPGKKALLIVTQGFGEDKHRDVIERYTGFLRHYGFDIHVIRAVNCGADPATNVDKQLEEASRLAEKMIKLNEHNPQNII